MPLPFPSDPPSKEFCDALIELNRLSGNSILGPLPRCKHGMIAGMCTSCEVESNK